MNAPDFPTLNMPDRALADYQADLVRRFGRLPTLRELAKTESKLAKATFGNYNSGDQAAIRAAFEAHPARMAMLVAMAEPMTSGEISRLTGQHKSSVQQAIARGVQAGLIRRTGVDKKHATIWERTA